jgi:murein L,D-transpeptidase YcbB/YkuD
LTVVLLLAAGVAAADLRTTLSPFAGTDEPAAEPPLIDLGGREIELYSPRLLAEFYAERDFRAAWDGARAATLLDLAQASRADGFKPQDFHAKAIAALLDDGDLESDDPGRRTTAELLLSDALLRYVHHFRFGKHNPRHVNPSWTFVEPADAEQLKADMGQALATPDMAEELAATLPSPDFYRNLKRGYQRYLAIADRGGWEDIPAGPNLRVGAEDPRVPLIREHLQVIDGYEPVFVAEPEIYDEDLAEAVKGFQRRSGLAADGIVGPNTLRALNVPLDERLLAIRANLERMRWLYNDLPADYLFVDLTAFELYLVRDGEEAWRTRGIIGTVEDQTPMFRDEMEYLVFNPTWTVPRSIEKKFKGVPAGYKRVRSGGQYYLVQQPGPRNALGRVKFMFPNGHAIYLHDTPSRYLFNRSRRAYSHGCVRVHQPLTLAEQVLNKPAWSQAEINRVVRRGKTRWVHLDEHLPVLLYYLTAKADAKGRVGFRRDIYNRDRRLFAMLDEPAENGAARIAFAEPEPEPDANPADEPVGDNGEAVAATTEASAEDEEASVEQKAEVAAQADDTATTGGGGDTEPAAGGPGALPAESGVQTASATEDNEEPAGERGGLEAPEAESQPRQSLSSEVADTLTDGAATPDAPEPSAEARPELQQDADHRSGPASAADAAVSIEGDGDGTATAKAEAMGAPPLESGVLAPWTQTENSRAETVRLDAEGRFSDRASDVWTVTESNGPAAQLRVEPVRLDLSEQPPRIGLAPTASPGEAAAVPSARAEHLDPGALSGPAASPVWTLPVD